MGKNKDNKGRQQGAVNHAPSQHGDKTRRKQAEIAQPGASAADIDRHHHPSGDEANIDRASMAKRKS